jgi:hypothetical protein
VESQILIGWVRVGHMADIWRAGPSRKRIAEAAVAGAGMSDVAAEFGGRTGHQFMMPGLMELHMKIRNYI